MKRFILTMGGFALLYMCTATLSISSYWESCGAWDFCVIPSNAMHPWLIWFPASEVAGFADAALYLLGTVLLIVMWGAVFLWGLSRFEFADETALAVGLAGCAPPSALLFALWYAGTMADQYGPHPVLFWHEQMFIQTYLVVMMGVFSLIAFCLILCILCSSFSRFIHHWSR